MCVKDTGTDKTQARTQEGVLPYNRKVHWRGIEREGPLQRALGQRELGSKQGGRAWVNREGPLIGNLKGGAIRNEPYAIGGWEATVVEGKGEEGGGSLCGIRKKEPQAVRHTREEESGDQSGRAGVCVWGVVV